MFLLRASIRKTSEQGGPLSRLWEPGMQVMSKSIAQSIPEVQVQCVHQEMVRTDQSYSVACDGGGGGGCGGGGGLDGGWEGTGWGSHNVGNRQEFFLQW